jgi:hypothetical protein
LPRAGHGIDGELLVLIVRDFPPPVPISMAGGWAAMETIMDLAEQLLDVERRLWKNDVDLYRDNLVEDALLVFPETGVIDRTFALDAIRIENSAGSRWADVNFEDVRALPLVPDAAVLTYRVTARWAHEATEMTALASSVYVRRNGGWKVALHQQSPI